jgi:magnesium-transporting ATPase (P-type)
MNVEGLNAFQIEESRRLHGSNLLSQIPSQPLWKKFVLGFKDPMVLILVAAFIVQLALFICGEAEWYELAGVMMAIVISVAVSAFSEFRQERKASSLKAEELAKERVKVVRDGRLVERPVGDIVVGDVVSLQAGDKIPADGEIVSGVPLRCRSSLPSSQARSPRSDMSAPCQLSLPFSPRRFCLPLPMWCGLRPIWPD